MLGLRPWTDLLGAPIQPTTVSSAAHGLSHCSLRGFTWFPLSRRKRVQCPVHWWGRLPAFPRQVLAVSMTAPPVAIHPHLETEGHRGAIDPAPPPGVGIGP